MAVLVSSSKAAPSGEPSATSTKALRLIGHIDLNIIHLLKCIEWPVCPANICLMFNLLILLSALRPHSLSRRFALLANGRPSKNSYVPSRSEDIDLK